MSEAAGGGGQFLLRTEGGGLSEEEAGGVRAVGPGARGEARSSHQKGASTFLTQACSGPPSGPK